MVAQATIGAEEVFVSSFLIAAKYTKPVLAWGLHTGLASLHRSVEGRHVAIFEAESEPSLF